MAPKKNDGEKNTESNERNEERFVAIEKEVGKISTLERLMGDMALKVTEMAGAIERLEQRSRGQFQERGRREEGPLSSGLISNPVSASKAPAYVGEGSGKAVEGEPRSAYEARFMEETGPEEGSS